MSKETQYMMGRNDGLAMAVKLVREGGLEALEAEIRLRKATRLNTPLVGKELDKITAPFKDILYETIVTAVLAVLHDEFGFGQKRCQRVMSAFGKLTRYLDMGWMYWMDIIQELREKLGLELVDDAMKAADMGGKYAHPEPGDIYEEPDLVDPVYWKSLLRDLKFTEQELDSGEMQVLDENKQPVFEYSGKFEQIGMYDILTGVLWERTRHEST